MNSSGKAAGCGYCAKTIIGDVVQASLSTSMYSVRSTVDSRNHLGTSAEIWLGSPETFIYRIGHGDINPHSAVWGGGSSLMEQKVRRYWGMFSRTGPSGRAVQASHDILILLEEHPNNWSNLSLIKPSAYTLGFSDNASFFSVYSACFRPMRYPPIRKLLRQNRVMSGSAFDDLKLYFILFATS